jgi:UTP--glucose-1-phosphate uridylyltransferase
VQQLSHKPVRKAIIPAAGWGTRFLPATKAQPKEMLPIVDKPSIQYIVEEAVASGIEDIIIVTGKNKRAIEDHFDRAVELEAVLREKGDQDLIQLVEDLSNMVDIHYVRQKEARGLGHAVYCARKFIGDEPFAVLLGDDLIESRVPCLRQLLDVYEEIGGTVLAVQQVPLSDVKKYGIIDPGDIQVRGRTGTGKRGTPRAALHGISAGDGSAAKAVDGRLIGVRDLVEKPAVEDAPSRYAVIGRYIITPEIFNILGATPPGASGEIQLTDALRSLAKRQPIHAYLFEGVRFDVGDKLGFLEATVHFALERPELGASFKRFLVDVVRELEQKEASAGTGEQVAVSIEN